ncbi:preprotein translocase subunit SecE [bacterium]|nr:preprotein translocase subunit SecE [bacterium]MBR2858357.1 preprotein translocase subunit SecE [bacterium]
MGKEFFRIRWSSKKSLLFNFITVVSISLILAIIFFAIDAIFSIF